MALLSAVRHFEFGWQDAAGLQIFGQGWQPTSPPEAVACLIHGIGEHSGRYLLVAEALGQAGLALLAHDHPGHGQSQGKRGDIAAYDIMLDGITRLLAEAGQRYPNLPCFLYGHSLGGNLALNYVLRRRPQLAGVIVTAPWLRLTTPIPAYQMKALGVINTLWPVMALPIKLNPHLLSRNEAVAPAYLADPLVHNRVSVRLFYVCLQAAEWALAHAAEFPLPLLLMHGMQDQITDPVATQQFAVALPNLCTLKLWPGLYHEIHNEPEQAEVLNFIIDWMQIQILKLES